MTLPAAVLDVVHAASPGYGPTWPTVAEAGRWLLRGCPPQGGGGPAPDPSAPITMVYELGTVGPPSPPLDAGHLRGGGSASWWADASPEVDPFWSTVEPGWEVLIEVAGEWSRITLGTAPVLDPGGWWRITATATTDSPLWYTVEGVHPGAVVSKVVGT